jgi:hypothetical protein
MHRPSLVIQPVLVDEPVHCSTTDAEGFGGLHLVPAGLGENVPHVPGLDRDKTVRFDFFP